jgi:hypothetical protein
VGNSEYSEVVVPNIRGESSEYSEVGVANGWKRKGKKEPLSRFPLVPGGKRGRGERHHNTFDSSSFFPSRFQ